MQTHSLTLLILALAATTFATRFVPMAWLSEIDLPAWMADWLRLVPGAVLAASLAQALLIDEGHLALSLGNVGLLAALPTFVVAWRTRSMIRTMFTGIAAYALLSRLLA